MPGQGTLKSPGHKIESGTAKKNFFKAYFYLFLFHFIGPPFCGFRSAVSPLCLYLASCVRLGVKKNQKSVFVLIEVFKSYFSRKTTVGTFQASP